MVALSTLWFGARCRSAGEQAMAAASLGFASIELARETSVEGYDDLPRALERTDLRVVSIQVGCRSGPVSESSLSSADEGRRSRAIEEVLALVDLGRQARCSLLTVSGGVVDGLGERVRRFQGLLGRRHSLDSLEEAREEISIETNRGRDRHLDRLCRSLHQVFAREPSLRLALETPDELHAVLTPQTCRLIFEDLPGKGLAYVHDTGRAGVLAALGGPPAPEWAENLASRIAGVRLHDHVDLQSGYPPGSGGVDFSLVASYTPRQAARILVTDSRFDREALLEGRRFLRKHGF